jgi:hypothetical protein
MLGLLASTIRKTKVNLKSCKERRWSLKRQD